PAIVQSPKTTPWVASWDAAGRVSWLRKLTARGSDGWVERLDALADGQIRAVGLSHRRLTAVPHAGLVPPDAPDTRAPAAPRRVPTRQATFTVHWDGAPGVSRAVRYLPRSRVWAAAGDDLIDADASRPRDGEQTFVTALAASDGGGATRWRTELDAYVG